MENLLASRLSRDEEPTKLQNLSPQKFGKGAFANLSYTPSKLADNFLFREATTMKKIEEGSSKFRELDAMNNFLKDRLKQLLEERDGIEQSLSQQIVMYKRMLHEMENKHEQRIRDIQKGFNEEMQKILIDKEEEAKYSQSEKELLENRIIQLESIIADLKDQLSHGGNNFETLTNDHEKLQIHYNNLSEKLEETERKQKEDSEKAKAEYEQLSRKLYNTQVEYKGKIDKILLEKDKERQNLQRFHRVELEKVQNQRNQESIMKNQQLKDLAETFEAEAQRLNDIIVGKDKIIQHQSNLINDEKEKFLEMTKSYMNEVSNLVHQKSRFKEEVQNLQFQNSKLKENYRGLEAASAKEIGNLEAYLAKLKDQLQLNQVNYIRERDRSGFLTEDLHREINNLILDNEKISALAGENSILCKEVRNLKDLLLQSSLEMERCKEQFLRLGREKDHLLIKLREIGIENQTLHKIKADREEEARGWRDSYYINRR